MVQQVFLVCIELLWFDACQLPELAFDGLEEPRVALELDLELLHRFVEDIVQCWQQAMIDGREQMVYRMIAKVTN